MGAIVHEAGVAFRVWAPHADKVSVIGTFNNWDPDADPLEPEEHGYWYADVDVAKVGHEYKFHLQNGKQQLDRIDPYARQVTNSVGNAVI
jgi:1,4-alpha-glucan branching enzyme